MLLCLFVFKFLCAAFWIVSIAMSLNSLNFSLAVSNLLLHLVCILFSSLEVQFECLPSSVPFLIMIMFSSPFLSVWNTFVPIV